MAERRPFSFISASFQPKNYRAGKKEKIIK
jgi:hypothetical protein